MSDPTRLAGYRFTGAEPLEGAVRRGIERVKKQMASPAQRPPIVVSPRTYDTIVEWSKMSQIERDIERTSGTYQERTTALGMLRAAQRMAHRRGQKFDPWEWAGRVTTPAKDDE